MSSPTPTRLLRLRAVLDLYPVSRSRWYAGVKSGEYPKPVRLGKNSVAWKESDIQALLDATVSASEDAA